MGRYSAIPDEFPRLESSELKLRELSEEDLPAWFARLRDAQAATLAGDPVAENMQTVRDALAHHQRAFRNKEGLRWSVVPQSVGSSVGTIGFTDFTDAARSAAIGGAIGRAFWGRGIATEAGRLALRYAFEALELKFVVASVLPENARVIRVLEKLGFNREAGSAPEPTQIGDRADSLLFRIERPGWR